MFMQQKKAKLKTIVDDCSIERPTSQSKCNYHFKKRGFVGGIVKESERERERVNSKQLTPNFSKSVLCKFA
jgi:hypothetical protein